MTDDNTNRHGQLDLLRAKIPVYFDEPGKCFFLTRYDDVRSYLLQHHSKDPDLAEPGTFLEKAGKPVNPERPDDPGSIGYLDPPVHQRVRHPISKALYRRIAAARPIVEEVVAEKLEALARQGEFDVIEDYAVPVPTETFARMLGVESADLPRFRSWAQASFKIFQTDRTVEETFAMNSANEQFSSWLDVAMIERRARPRDDLITDLVQTQTTDTPLSDGEIRANCISLVVASIMTTTDLIGSGTLLLLNHPAELAKLKADPELIKPAVEEMLRLDPPIEGEWRVAVHDLEIGGCPIRKGQVVAVSLNAANHDPSVFEDPHSFNITRPPRPHLAFGAGEHICLGAPLGRLTAQIAIGSFFERFPNARHAVAGAPPKWRKVQFFRGLDELMVAA